MKVGYTKRHSNGIKRNANDLKKMRAERFTVREREKVERKVRFRQNLNDFSHRVLGTRKSR
tara:strand:+ start:2857 stop:3039 length:183 start_codon:yes stop_codon:yes gene_type:complete